MAYALAADWEPMAQKLGFSNDEMRHPELQSGDVLLFYVSFSLLLFFHTFLSARFLGDALIKIYETL